MSATGRRLFSRSIAAAAIAIAVLAIGVSPALADTELRHTGRVGKHKLRDKAQMDGTHSFFVSPGVTCFYDGNTNELVIISIRAPKIWARDTTSARNSQTVGYQAIVKRFDNAKNVTTFAKTSIEQGAAYDDAFADLSDVSVETTFPQFSDYLVIIKMFWYRHDSVEGTARHIVDYYNEAIPPGQPQAVGSCPDRYLN